MRSRANLLDYDDTHLRTVSSIRRHPLHRRHLLSRNSVGCQGPAMLHAFILGAEVECRIGNSVSPGHYGARLAYHFDLRRASALPRKREAARPERGADWHALGIAASQSAGLVENLPSSLSDLGA